MKNQKGITLVALVITIVVLLILAGVTISMVMGDNGILSNSQKAKQESAKGAAKDALTTALADIQMEYYAGGATSGTAVSGVTVTALEGLMPDFKGKITVDDSATPTTDGKIIVMTDKDGYEFSAYVTKDLGIGEFKRTAGGSDAETFEATK